MHERKRSLRLAARPFRIAALLALVLAVAGGAPHGAGAGEGDASTAGASAARADESLVSYVTRRWIPVSGVRKTMRLRFRGRCRRGTNVRMRVVLRWPGPDLGPFRQSYSACGHDVDPSLDVVVFQFWKELTRGQVNYLRAHRAEVRLRTRIRGFDPDTGELDIDRRTFRFSR